MEVWWLWEAGFGRRMRIVHRTYWLGIVVSWSDRPAYSLLCDCMNV